MHIWFDAELISTYFSIYDFSVSLKIKKIFSKNLIFLLISTSEAHVKLERISCRAHFVFCQYLENFFFYDFLFHLSQSGTAPSTASPLTTAVEAHHPLLSGALGRLSRAGCGRQVGGGGKEESESEGRGTHRRRRRLSSSSRACCAVTATGVPTSRGRRPSPGTYAPTYPSRFYQLFVLTLQ